MSHLNSGEPRRTYLPPREKKRDLSAEAGLPELNTGDMWLNSDQVAELVNVERGTIHSWISRGRPRHSPFPPREHRMLRTNYWRFSTVRNWLHEARGVYVISPPSTSEPQAEELNIAQVARIVGAKRDTIYGWISRREPADRPFPAADTKRQGRNFWRPSTIHAWQQSRAADHIVTIADPSQDLEDVLSRVQVLRLLTEGRAQDEAVLTALRRSDGALAALGCGEGALRACRKTILRYRADSRRHDFQLASALARSGVILRSLNKLDEAEFADREAVDLYRHAMLEPSTFFAKKFAHVLGSYARTLASIDRLDAALIVYDEQAAVYANLMETFPRKFGFKDDLAMVLATKGHALFDLSRIDEAMATYERAIDILRELAAQRPRTYDSDLAIKLQAFAEQLYKRGRHERALLLTEEAAECSRRVVNRKSLGTEWRHPGPCPRRR